MDNSLADLTQEIVYDICGVLATEIFSMGQISRKSMRIYRLAFYNPLAGNMFSRSIMVLRPKYVQQIIH